MQSNNLLNSRTLKKSIIPIIALLFVFIISDLFSATIKLNNGKTIKGRILSSKKGIVTVRVKRRKKKIKIKDIKDITKYNKKDKRVKLPVKAENKLAKKVADDTGKSFVDKYDLRMGGMAGISLPLGDLTSAVGMGYGGLIFADMKIPQSFAKSFMFRANVLTGFLMYPGKSDVLEGFLGSAPFLLGVEASYPVKLTSIELRPYFGLAGGISYNFISGTASDDRDVSSTSSIDGTISVRIGTGITMDSLKNVEFLVDVNYIMAMETVMGTFLAVQVGAAYRFSGPTVTKRSTRSSVDGSDNLLKR